MCNTINTYIILFYMIFFLILNLNLLNIILFTMVYSVKCIVCGLKNENNPDISFHNIPKNEAKQRMWADSLGLENFKTNSKVCSLHFNTSDYIMSTERKILLSNAIPRVAGSNENDVEIVQLNIENIYETPSSPVAEEMSATDLQNDTHKRTLTPTTSIEDVTLMKTPKKRKFWSSSRFGDLTADDFSTPRRLKRNFSIIKNKIKNVSYANKLLTQKNKRLEMKIKTLNDIISQLKQKSLLNESSADIIKALGSDVLEQIVKEILEGKKKMFNPELRKFAVTLQYYSPKAYTYVRKSFKNILPHPRTLRRWYMVVNGKPGFTSEAFDVLKEKCKIGPVYCNLTVDEVCIKKYVEVDTQNNVYGYIDLGTGQKIDDDGCLPLARNALVFLVVGLNAYWKLPIAYFLIDSMTGSERGNILRNAIVLISETGAHVHSVTFDGTNVNTTMCTSLGANFDLSNPKPYFTNPPSIYFTVIKK